MFTFSILDSKYALFGKFGPKNRNCNFKLKFHIWTNLNMETSIVMLNFFALDKKHTFWANLLQKIKMVISY